MIEEIRFFICWRLRVKGWEMINHADINWTKRRTVLTIRPREQLCVARELSMLTHDCKPSTFGAWHSRIFPSSRSVGTAQWIPNQPGLHTVRICVNTKTPAQRKFPQTYWTMKKGKSHWSRCGTHSTCSRNTICSQMAALYINAPNNRTAEFMKQNGQTWT